MYFCYHRGDVNNGSRFKRSVCYDKITFRDYGTIGSIVYTLDEGVKINKPIYKKSKRKKVQKTIVVNEKVVKACADGSFRFEAQYFSEKNGVKIGRLMDGEESLGLVQVSNGNWVGYKDIDFGKSSEPFSFRVRVSALNNGGAIVLRVNSPTGAILDEISVPKTGDYNIYKTLSTKLNRIRGKQTIYFCFKGGDKSLFNINWFEWTPTPHKRKSH